jgi:hypothetical protein
MNLNIHHAAGANAEQHYEQQQGSRRLWAAVILQAIEDWQSGSLRRREEAERFFFQSQKDFASVCRSAGLDPMCMSEKIKKMRETVKQRPVFSMLQVA